MAKKKRSRSRGPETFMRIVEIARVSAGLTLHPSHEKGADPEFESRGRLELVGTMDEPVRDVRDVCITIYSDAKPTIESALLP